MALTLAHILTSAFVTVFQSFSNCISPHRYLHSLGQAVLFASFTAQRQPFNILDLPLRFNRAIGIYTFNLASIGSSKRHVARGTPDTYTQRLWSSECLVTETVHRKLHGSSRPISHSTHIFGRPQLVTGRGLITRVGDVDTFRQVDPSQYLSTYFLPARAETLTKTNTRVVSRDKARRAKPTSSQIL